MEESRQKVLNVGLLGLAFMLVFTAFQTMGNVQTTILKSASNKTSDGYVEGFTGDGYTSLAIIYSVFSFANWLAPSAVALIGQRFTLVGGGICYALFIAQLMYPNNILLYGASALIGFGAAMIWTAQGNFLTLNSDERTMERNSGIFWAMLQCSLLIGNTFVFIQFQGLTDIDKSTRTIVAAVLLSICVAGVLTFFLLRPTPWADATDSSAVGSPTDALKRAFQLCKNADMLLLAITFAYSGIVLTFWSGVYGSSIGFTKEFGDKAKSLVGMHGIIVGVGEMLGGLLFGIFGHLLAKHGRDPPVILGFVVHMAAFFIAFINLPSDAPFGDTNKAAYITSNEYLAIVGSFLLGFGDACYNTQIYAILGGLFSNDSAPAFAIFKFVQSFTAATAFYYSLVLLLPYQLLILGILCIFGTIAFLKVEWKAQKNKAAVPMEPKDDDGAQVDNSCAVGAEDNKSDSPEDTATTATSPVSND